MKNIVILILIISTLVSCKKVLDIELPQKDGSIVVNCIFNTEDTMVVNVSKSLHILDNLEFKSIGTAAIQVFDENNTLVSNFIYSSNGTYKSYVDLTAGKEYRINVHVPNMTDAIAANYIPVPIQILSVDTFTVYETINDGFGYSYSINSLKCKIRFQDPGSVLNYYSLSAKLDYETTYPMYYGDTIVDITEKGSYPLYFNTDDPIIEEQNNDGQMIFSDDLINGKNYEMTLSIDKSMFTYSKNTLKILLNSIPREYYLYARSYNQQQATKGDPFSEPVQVFTNIENGYGIFAGYSSSVFSIDVPTQGYYYYEDIK